MFIYSIRFFLLVTVCLSFGSLQSFGFKQETEEALRTAYHFIPPITKKTVEESPSQEQVPLVFNVALPTIKELSFADGERFFDDHEEQEKHSIYQLSLIFKGLSPSTISYKEKESGIKQKVKIENKSLGFLDIKIVYNRETGQRVAYLDEVNFEPHVQGLGLGHIALTFFTKFADSLKCDLSFLKLLSHEGHAGRLYEGYGFVFTQRSLDKLEACGITVEDARKDSGTAVAAISDEHSPLKMVRVSETDCIQASTAGSAGTASPAKTQPLSPSKTTEVSTPMSPPTPLKKKAAARRIFDDVNDKENNVPIVVGE